MGIRTSRPSAGKSPATVDDRALRWGKKAMTEQSTSYVMNTVLVSVIFIAVMLVGASVVDLSIGELALDLAAGAIGGLAVIAMMIWNSRKTASAKPVTEGGQVS